MPRLRLSLVLTVVPEASSTDRSPQPPLPLPPAASVAPGPGIAGQSAGSQSSRPAGTSAWPRGSALSVWPVAPFREFPDNLPDLPSLTCLLQGQGLGQGHSGGGAKVTLGDASVIFYILTGLMHAGGTLQGADQDW
jgi:hypothetical protein